MVSGQTPDTAQSAQETIVFIHGCSSELNTMCCFCLVFVGFGATRPRPLGGTMCMIVHVYLTTDDLW